MRNTIAVLAFFTISLIATKSYAQANIGCMDKAIRLQSEQIKYNFKQQGMVVYKDAMIKMEPKTPFPIGVQLVKGQTYQLVFVGNRQATHLQFELFDGKDNKIGEMESDNPDKSNMIIYSFVPEKTDLYLVVLTQKIKQKSVCSSFCILEKEEGRPQQAPPTTQPANNTYPLKRGKNIDKK